MKEIKEIVPAHEKICYLADDGKAFNSKEECVAWEERLLADKIFSKRHYIIEGYESYDFDYRTSVSEEEHWFVVGNEATPELLISYISYSMHIFLSEYRKKYILNYFKKDHSAETVNGNFLAGIIFVMDKCGDVDEVKLISINEAYKELSSLKEHIRDKENDYEDLILDFSNFNKPEQD